MQSNKAILDGADRPRAEDDEFFLEDAYMVIQVEDKLFRLPSSKLTRESYHFWNITKRPGYKSSSRENPIELPDIKAIEFKLLLRLLNFSSSSAGNSPASYNKQEWHAVLRLSTKLVFLKARRIAIEQLSNLKPGLTTIQKIQLGRELFVHKWLLEGYLRLAKRDTPISEAEGRIIGVNAVVKLFHIREARLHATETMVMMDGNAGFSILPDADESPSPLERVKQIFREELAEIKKREQPFLT